MASTVLDAGQSKGNIYREARHRDEHQDIVGPKEVPPDPETGVGTKGDDDERERPQPEVDAHQLCATIHRELSRW